MKRLTEKNNLHMAFEYGSHFLIENLKLIHYNENLYEQKFT